MAALDPHRTAAIDRCELTYRDAKAQFDDYARDPLGGTNDTRLRNLADTLALAEHWCTEFANALFATHHLSAFVALLRGDHASARRGFLAVTKSTLWVEGDDLVAGYLAALSCTLPAELDTLSRAEALAAKRRFGEALRLYEDLAVTSRCSGVRDHGAQQARFIRGA